MFYIGDCYYSLYQYEEANRYFNKAIEYAEADKGYKLKPTLSYFYGQLTSKLEEENKIDRSRVKKLAVKNRKVGSFGPMCSLIASMIGMEAIKILSKCCRPANINRRGEFDIYSMDVSYKEYNKRLDCDWCGVNGLYSDAKYPRE